MDQNNSHWPFTTNETNFKFEHILWKLETLHVKTFRIKCIVILLCCTQKHKLMHHLKTSEFPTKHFQKYHFQKITLWVKTYLKWDRIIISKITLFIYFIWLPYKNISFSIFPLIQHAVGPKLAGLGFRYFKWNIGVPNV